MEQEIVDSNRLGRTLANKNLKVAGGIGARSGTPGILEKGPELSGPDV